MRKSAMLWLFLAALCGGVLFHTSQRVNDGRAELARIGDSLRREEESLRVLQAEWSYLNQPDRLEKLAKRHLGLEPLRGSQFAAAESLEDRAAEVQPETQPATDAAAAEEKPAQPVKAVKIAPATPPPSSPALRAAPPRPQRTAPATTGQPRSFTDVMNGLGVR